MTAAPVSRSESIQSPLKFSIQRILQDDSGPELKGCRAEMEVDGRIAYPAWVYCTRYSDRPTSGNRSRRHKRKESATEEKRRVRRTAFTTSQLTTLKHQFIVNQYLTEKRRQELARELGLNESQIKIWFQNKRAKVKKTWPDRPALASLNSLNVSVPANNQ